MQGGPISRTTETILVHHALVQSNGASFHVIDQGHGPAVLFCHGFPDTAETWRSQMRAVAEAGYRAVAVDMRGYGDSYAPDDSSLYTSLHVVGDLVGVLDALEIPSAVLVGHDWGADYAQRAALMRPDRFTGLVSLSIPFAPRGEVDFWTHLRRQGLGERYYAFGMIDVGSEARYEPAAATIPRILYWLSASPPSGTGWDPIDPSRHMLRPSPVTVPDWADPEYVHKSIRSFEKTGFRGGLNYYRVVPTTFELTAAFKDAVIRQPTLYIYGDSDGLCEFFHPVAPTPTDLRHAQPGLVDVVRLEATGHWPQHEAADRVNTELVRFLDRSGSVPGPERARRRQASSQATNGGSTWS